MISVIFEGATLSRDFAARVAADRDEITSLPIHRHVAHSIPLNASAIARVGYDAACVARLNAIASKHSDYLIVHDATDQVAVTSDVYLPKVQQLGGMHPINLLQETLIESYDVIAGKVRCKVYVEDDSEFSWTSQFRSGLQQSAIKARPNVEIGSVMNLKDYNPQLANVTFRLERLVPGALSAALDGVTLIVLGRDL